MKFHVMHEICMKLDILCSRKSAGKVIPMVIPMSDSYFVVVQEIPVFSQCGTRGREYTLIVQARSRMLHLL